MITIRNEQMALVAMRHLEQRTAEHFLVEYPDQAGRLTPANLAKLISDSFVRAARYGIRSEAALEGFAALALLVSPKFDEHPRLRAILTDPEIPADYRVLLLGETTNSRDWLEAGRQ